MKKIKSCKYFIIPAVVLIIISGAFLLAFNRTEIHLWGNQYHKAWADVFFKNITHLGDGLIFLIALPLLFFKNLRWFFIIALTAIFVLLVTALAKQVLFSGLPRPSAFLDQYNLYLVSGVKMHSINSFPSGHTLAAFALYFVLCFLVSNKLTSFLLFLLATFVGLSRVYLSQHFLIDITAGAILGILCGYFAVAIVGSLKWKTLDLNLIKLLKKDA